MVPVLPPEIIREIFLKLRVESLLRCKSVCKEWYSLISDQHFIKTHYTLSSSSSTNNNINYSNHRLILNKTEFHQLSSDNYEIRNNLLSCPLYDVLFHESVSNAIQLGNPLQQKSYDVLLYKFFNNAIELDNPLQLPPSRGFRIVGSCNGLMCLREEFNDTLFIYNPTTRRSNLLPCSHPIRLSEADSHGFGYDELSRDYKVVIARARLPSIIYSFKTGKWKEIGCFPYRFMLNNAKFLNGALHWVPGDESWSDSRKIVSLDLASETYGEVLQPEYHDEGGYLELAVAGESLCLLLDYSVSPVVDVWVMKVYGVKDSWTKLASISYPYTCWGPFLTPFYISEDRKLLLQFEKNLVVYDLQDRSSSVIDRVCIDACIVVES